MSFLYSNFKGYEAIKLRERVLALEEKVFGKKKPPITLNQQVLLLKHLGMLDAIHQLNIPMEKKYELLALLLKGDKSNTKKAWISLGKKDEDIINGFNYEYLKKLFDDFELTDKAIEANSILAELQTSDSKK